MNLSLFSSATNGHLSFGFVNQLALFLEISRYVKFIIDIGKKFKIYPKTHHGLSSSFNILINALPSAKYFPPSIRMMLSGNFSIILTCNDCIGEK